MINKSDFNNNINQIINFELQKFENISILYIHIKSTYYKHCLMSLNEYVHSLSDDLKNTIVISSSS